MNFIVGKRTGVIFDAEIQYKNFKKRYPGTEISEGSFGLILRTFNTLMMSEVLYKGTVFKWPYGCGLFYMEKEVVSDTGDMIDIDLYHRTGEKKKIARREYNILAKIRSYGPEAYTDIASRSLVFKPFTAIIKVMRKLNKTTNVSKNYQQKK